LAREVQKKQRVFCSLVKGHLSMLWRIYADVWTSWNKCEGVLKKKGIYLVEPFESQTK
jgi:hypothetical protein